MLARGLNLWQHTRLAEIHVLYLYENSQGCLDLSPTPLKNLILPIQHVENLSFPQMITELKSLVTHCPVTMTLN